MTVTEKFQVWYSEAIGKVRVTADPGGDALTIEQAEALRAELDAAISEAKTDGDETE